MASSPSSLTQPNAITIDNAITLKEYYYNIDPLNLLLQVDTTHPDYDEENMMWSAEQMKIQNLMKKWKYDGKANAYYNNVDYKVKDYCKITLGRMYPDNVKGSYQNMFNTLRRLVIDGNLYSLDIENAHPTLLEQCCAKVGYISIPLNIYNKNRKKVIVELMEHYKTSRDNIKNLFVRMSFGGTPDAWATDFKIKNVAHHHSITEFHKEIVYIKTEKANLFQNFNDALNYYGVYEKRKKGSRLYDSVLAVYLQDLERQCMSITRAVCKAEGIEVQSLIHDEVLTSKEVSSEVIQKIQDRIKNDIGYTLNFSAKQTVPTDEDKQWLESHTPFIKKVSKMMTYDTMKEEFEKTNFKLVDLSEYGTWKNNKLICRKKGDFKEAYLEMKFKKYCKVARDIVEVSFIDEWFHDANKRKYDTYDFIPPPLVCPSTVFNIWKGFDMERVDDEAKDCSRILELVNVLCEEHTESYEYVLNWLADMIQNPGKKCGTAVVLKSKQGAGKGTLVEIMRLMMGEYVSETANPLEDIFGSHGNVHIQKIMTSLDEVKKGDVVKVLGRLKNYITSNTCNYNEKGLKIVEVKNCSRFLFTTNESIPVSVDADDRRYCLIECSNKLCKDGVFWKDFYKSVVEDIGVIKGFYNFLKARDVSNVSWMKFPDTEFRNDIIQASLHPLIFFMDSFIQSSRCANTVNKYTSSQLFDHYKRYCADTNINCSGNAKGFGIMFKDHIPFDECNIKKVKSHGVNCYTIDKNAVFEWLKKNEYTSYEELKIFVDDDDDDDV